MPGSNSSAQDASIAEELALTVHRMPAPNLADPAEQAAGRTARGRLKMLVLLAVCAAPVVASYFTYFVVRPGLRTNYGALIVPTRGLPDLALQRLDGSPVAAQSLKGQWLLVVVGPSACDAACDKRLFMQRQLREMLGRERERVDKIWLVTDAAPLSPRLRAATEESPALTVLRANRAALAQWLAPAEGHALEEHLYLVDPMGEWMMRMPPQPDPARVKRDLDRLLRASASWDLPGR